jgi:hypothetical protein
MSRKHYLEHRQEYIDRALAWKKANPDKIRKSKRKARGMIDPPGERRTGPCEICGKVKKLYVDHSHLTGKFRGWLCHRCNQALGWWEAIVTEGLDKKFQAYLIRPCRPDGC